MATTVALDEAARRLRIHPQTLRRRLHKGLIPGVKQETPQGYVWRVELDDGAAPESTHPDASAASTRSPESGGLAQEVARLSAHVDDLREQLRAREREAGQLHTLLAQANQRLLADGRADRSAGLSDRNGSAPPTESWPEGRRWWQRLLWS